jgi:hypothetical protein
MFAIREQVGVPLRITSFLRYTSRTRYDCPISRWLFPPRELQNGGELFNMPRIAKRYLQCVGYIYPDKESAQTDKAHGGSCFIVARLVDGGFQTFVIRPCTSSISYPTPLFASTA